MHIGGNVEVSVTILPNGKVAEAHAVAGHPLLQAAAERAVRRWRFSPASATSVNIVEIRFNSDPNA